jgi:hypothetical protein
MSTVRGYHLIIFGIDGHFRQVSLSNCPSEICAVVEALSILEGRSVELRRGKRCILRVELPATAAEAKAPFLVA